jgi:hypothetical protein
MEIKSKFEGDILSRIDEDFKEELIDENDVRVDEVEL